MHIYTSIHIHTNTHTPIHSHPYTCTLTHIHIRIHTRTTYSHIHKYTLTYINSQNTYTHTHLHIYILTYSDTHFKCDYVFSRPRVPLSTSQTWSGLNLGRGTDHSGTRRGHKVGIETCICGRERPFRKVRDWPITLHRGREFLVESTSEEVLRKVLK